MSAVEPGHQDFFEPGRKPTAYDRRVQLEAGSCEKCTPLAVLAAIHEYDSMCCSFSSFGGPTENKNILPQRFLAISISEASSMKVRGIEDWALLAENIFTTIPGSKYRVRSL